jgi:hypothetical protein
VGVAKERHVACSGALVVNIEGGGQTHSPPDNVDQLTQLNGIAARTAIDRVLVTIGGNDSPVNFGKRLAACRFAPCLRDADKIVKQLPALGARLKRTYSRIQETSHAPLLVVGYPDLFPQPGTNVRRHCGWLQNNELIRFRKVASKLDQTMSAAASAAGADYLSMRDVLRGHELCTGHAYIRALVGLKPGDLTGDQQQGHPLLEGQLLMAERVLSWLGAHRRACTPADSVAAIVDDSGSMADNDPENIRRRALELLLTKQANQARTFGAVEFGGDAGALFGPGVVGPNQQTMLTSLDALRNDGFAGDSGTDYNAAFAASNTLQPNPGARIFLTDGGHNVGAYENGHLGGPPTYVIGLNIGPASDGDEASALLARIAAETGGRYFPLRLSPNDTPAVQVSRLQPVLNEIDTSIGCAAVQAQKTFSVNAPNRPSPAVSTVFGGAPGMEIVVSWPDPNDHFDLSSLTVRDGTGRVVGDLQGRKRIVHSKRRRTKLVVSTVVGQTFDTITMKRPPQGRMLTVQVTAPVLPDPTPATIQIRPIADPPTVSMTTVVSDGGPQSPKPTVTNLTVAPSGSNQVDVAFDAGWAAGRDPVTCHVFQDGAEVASEQCGAHYSKHVTGVVAGRHAYYATVSDNGGVASDPSNTIAVDVSDPPARVNAYDNYGGGAAGHAMCRGNPGNSASTPGGTVTQTFTAPPGVASLDTALVQIDPDNRVTGHLSLSVNGVQRASADAAAAGDTTFTFPSVSVGPGDSISLSVNFTASFGKIITVYTVGGGRGTFTTSNSCSAGADNTSTTSTALRAVLSGWSR